MRPYYIQVRFTYASHISPGPLHETILHTDKIHIPHFWFHILDAGLHVPTRRPLHENKGKVHKPDVRFHISTHGPLHEAILHTGTDRMLGFRNVFHMFFLQVFAKQRNMGSHQVNT